MTSTLVIQIAVLQLLISLPAQAESQFKACIPHEANTSSPTVPTLWSGPDGSPVRALAAGVVMFSDHLGNDHALIVNYGNGCLVAYRGKLHQYKQAADNVQAGEIIAIWGDE